MSLLQGFSVESKPIFVFYALILVCGVISVIFLRPEVNFWPSTTFQLISVGRQGSQGSQGSIQAFLHSLSISYCAYCNTRGFSYLLVGFFWLYLAISSSFRLCGPTSHAFIGRPPVELCSSLRRLQELLCSRWPYF